MPTQNQDLRYRLLGEDVSAGRTFSKVAKEAQAAHSAIGLLGNSLNATGTFTPLQQGLDAISQGFQHVEEHGKRTGVIMQGIGVGIAGLGAAFLAIGAKEQQAAAGLEQSIQATGNAYGDYKNQINAAISQQEKFGHSANDTEDALSRLVQASNDPREALQLLGLAANVAAARHISLVDASQTLAQALAGNTRTMRQFGITLDGVGSKSGQVQRAFDQLEQKLAGQAQAQADTFSGKIRAIGVHFEDLAASMAKFSPLLLTVGSGLTVVGAATDYLNRKRAEQAVIDDRVIAAEGGVATAEGRAAVAAAAAATSALPDLRSAEAAAALGGGGGLFGGLRGLGAASGLGIGSRLLRGGMFAAGGLVAGQVASGLVGGTGGSVLGGIGSGAGIGAGLGMLGGPLDFLSVPLGAGLGALAGGLFGLFGHHSTRSKQQQQLKLQLQQLDAQQQAQDIATFAGFLPGEFDALGNPKAAKLATANEALAKAKERLARAQDDLNRKRSRSEDPAAAAAATERLTAAEANLRRALYVGGDARIASARAAVDQAQAHLTALRRGTDLTAAQRRVADAQQAVTDAQKHVTEARTATTGLTAMQFLGRQRGNLRTEQQMAADQSMLADQFHLAKPILEAIDAANQQIPGTLHRVAETMTKSLAEQLNRNQSQWDAAKNAFTAAGHRAFQDAAQALGVQMANWQMTAYQRRLGQFQLQAEQNFNPNTARTVNQGRQSVVVGAANQQQATLGSGSTYIHNINVQANDPSQMARELEQQKRLRKIGNG